MMRYKTETEEEEAGELLIKEETLSDDAWDAASAAAAAAAAAATSSAFSQYRAVTVLTNLQRGNVQTEEAALAPQHLAWHTRAAMGEVTAQDLLALPHHGGGGSEGGGLIGAEDEGGLTALSWAAAYGQLTTVRLLLNHGADIEHEGEDGQTALHLACGSGHQDVTRLLLSAGAAPDHPDHMGCTALMFAAAGDHAACVTELLEQRASFTITNLADDTAYSVALARAATQAQSVLERYLVRLLEAQ